MKLGSLSLLSKIWLSSAVLLTLLFAGTGFILQRHMLETTSVTLQTEVRDSFQAYDSLWRARSETLASVSAVLSSMPNVRLAFQTRHQPTIRDAAGEVWLKVSDAVQESAFFAVADPKGNTVTSLDATAPVRIPPNWPMVANVRAQFPKQVSGFAVLNDQLFQLVLTPVYIDSTQGSTLMSILITGYVVNHAIAQRLKESTGGSEFLFLSKDRVYASTLNPRATAALRSGAYASRDLVSDGVSEYVPLERNLVNLEGAPIGKLRIFRSFDSARQRITLLQRNLILLWLLAVATGLGASYLLARRLIYPIKMLDRAAAEVTRQNYDFRVPVNTSDELGRLAATFNSMCASLQSARQELIRQERISTIGRMASSIVHDLRNPLAAIYGGAEMMVDTDLTPAQTKRLAENIYRSSRRIQEMLQDLLQVTRGNKGQRELCSLEEVVQAAVEAHRSTANAQNVTLESHVDPGIEIPLERQRMERVFLNLIGNALEALPAGGLIRINAQDLGDRVEVEVADNGPGIAPQIREQLFQPFASFGKKNGLGLGLALSRQSVLDHGGDLWSVDQTSTGGAGASFRLSLPKQPAFA
ncbi:MAG: HAMP domain-containing histidine kinase [Acidobacteriia bacterium]|nr:HAMP domain-containing histidine kinase [Terriglobia bacterium]